MFSKERKQYSHFESLNKWKGISVTVKSSILDSGNSFVLLFYDTNLRYLDKQDNLPISELNHKCLSQCF